MALRKQIICDTCGKTEAYDSDTTLPVGWWCSHRIVRIVTKQEGGAVLPGIAGRPRPEPKTWAAEKTVSDLAHFCSSGCLLEHTRAAVAVWEA